MTLVDMRIVDFDDCLPKKAVGYRALNPFMITDGRSRKSSFSYTLLPEKPLKLSVLKLDGSCFEIEVMKSGTIADLRRAVEVVFNHMPQKGPGKISWSHLWSHFCLTYDGQKLLMDTDCIRNYGIRDGDQLRFVRHISNNYSHRRKRTSKQVAAPEQHRNSLSDLDIYEDEELNEKEEYFHDRENGMIECYYGSVFEAKESKVSSFFKWWHQYTKLQRAKRSLKGSPPTKTSRNLWGNLRRIIQ